MINRFPGLSRLAFLVSALLLSSCGEDKEKDPQPSEQKLELRIISAATDLTTAVSRDSIPVSQVTLRVRNTQGGYSEQFSNAERPFANGTYSYAPSFTVESGDDYSLQLELRGVSTISRKSKLQCIFLVNGKELQNVTLDYANHKQHGSGGVFTRFVDIRIP